MNLQRICTLFIRHQCAAKNLQKTCVATSYLKISKGTRRMKKARKYRLPEEDPYYYGIGPKKKVDDAYQSLAARGFGKEVPSYKPPEDLEEQLHKLCMMIFGSQLDSDWMSQSLSDRVVKFKLLTKGMQLFKKDVPNSELHKIKKVGDVYEFFNLPVEGMYHYDALVRDSDKLPPNLHVMADSPRFNPTTDTFFDGVTAFPDRRRIVHTKTRSKYEKLDCMCHIDDSQHMVHSAAMEIVQNERDDSCIWIDPLWLVSRMDLSISDINGSRNGMITLFVHVLKNEKLVGLWRGTVPSIMRCVPGLGMYFSSVHWLQINLGSKNPSSVESFCFGALARSFAGATLLPVTVIKTRYESGIYSYSSLSQALYKIYRNEGRKGLFSGLVPTLIRDAPFSGMYLMFYTQAKKLIPPSVHERISPAPINFSCGVVAGMLAAGLTQPADVIKTKMQLYPQKYRSVPVSVTLVLKENGIVGFFSGMVPRIVRRTLMAAMAWTVYEQVINYTGLK